MKAVLVSVLLLAASTATHAAVATRPPIRSTGPVIPVDGDPERPNAIWFVRTDGRDANDGRTWAAAKQTLQAASDAAAPGDAIWVAMGAYSGVTLKQGLMLYGGFSGGDRLKTQRDWNKFKTVVGNAPQAYALAVVQASGTSSMTVIDGLTVSNPKGGGIDLGAADNVTVRNSRIVQSAGYVNNAPAGALLSGGSGIVIEHDLVAENLNGAAFGGSADVRNNVIMGNSGSGLSVGGANSRVSGNFICGNVGYGLQISGDGEQVVNNTIAGNGFGGVLLGSSSVVVANNIIALNMRGIVGNARNVGPLTFSHNDVYDNGGVDPTEVPSPVGTNGNIAIDPHLPFVVYADAHISPDSPCRDAGDSSFVQATDTDIDGQSRILGRSVDIGADESDQGLPRAAYPIFHVLPSGNDANDGLTWATAKRTIQGATDPNVIGSEIWVAQGSYQDFVTAPGFTHIFGGFAGTERTRSERDYSRHPATLTGHTEHNSSLIGFTGGFGEVDGFTLSTASAAVKCPAGGTIRNCDISGCNFGGYMFGYPIVVENNNIHGNVCGLSLSGSGTVSDNAIVDNYVPTNPEEGANQGAGVTWEGGVCRLLRNVIARNRNFADWNTDFIGAGGAWIDGTDIVAEGNVITRNVAGFVRDNYPRVTGGLRCVSEGGPATVRNNVITGNSVNGLFVYGMTENVRDNLVANNVALNAKGIAVGVGVNTVGSTMAGALASTVIVANNTIVGHPTNALVNTINATFANNIIAGGGIGLARQDSNPTPVSVIAARDSDFFGNTVDVQNYYSPVGRSGNTVVDPLFVNPAVGDFRLAPASLLRDLGDDFSVLPGETDLDGAPRIQGPHVDIGAYEMPALG